MPQSHAGRNAAEGINTRIRQVFAWRRALFARILEMAVGEARQRYFPALGVQKLWSWRPGHNGTYGGHGHPGQPRSLGECIKAILRDCAQNLVIVAAGNDRLNADGTTRDQSYS